MTRIDKFGGGAPVNQNGNDHRAFDKAWNKGGSNPHEMMTKGFEQFQKDYGHIIFPVKPGPQGPQGEKGEKGDKGDRGHQGIQGEKGDRGERGHQGLQGEKGEKGDRGERGMKGEQGERGERGHQGIQGEKGEKGDRGERGMKGEQGERGERGHQGIQGEKGEKGDRGERGHQGIQGEKGEKGDRGERGHQGIQGEKGDKGDRGERGAAGRDGVDGKDGTNGRDGVDGKDGKDGTFAEADKNGDGVVSNTELRTALFPSADKNGDWKVTEQELAHFLRGTDGKDGKDGADGKDGVDGMNGRDGKDGRNGVDGKDGKDGRDGIDGKDGKDGRDGIDGKDGKDGRDGVDGKDGKDGRDGVDGKDGKDGRDGVDGKDGKDGRDGVDGKDGKDGVDGKDGDDGHDCPPEHMDPIKVEHGRIWGDPHFVGADGGKYDVQGEAGKVYNILSDQGVQMNASFKAWNNPGTTVVEQVGLTIGHDQITINKDGSMDINGEHIAKGAEGSYLDGAVTVNDKGHITVQAGEYTITFDNFAKNSKSGEWINNIKITSENAVSDKVLPDGLWGTTVDGDGQARNGDRGKGTQGGGAIEDLHGNITQKGDKETVKEYEVSGLFDTDFANFNQFEAGKPANGGGNGDGGHVGGGDNNVDVDVDIDVDVDVDVIINRGGYVAAPAPKAETAGADIQAQINTLISNLKSTVMNALQEFVAEVKALTAQGLNAMDSHPAMEGYEPAPTVVYARRGADPMDMAMSQIRGLMAAYAEGPQTKYSENRMQEDATRILDRLGADMAQKATANQEAW